ncbi:hypothetical protein PsYK624_157320 [Phanerochaete sordida]|uniref:Uncharacterized protein n=1 Tax=Phanerochaete sordida TaxID=48140 RepID=A0A9P3GPF3_9APHY|nr:hypothetical protein PsYK624_157320 [Phanerochaete sordida]
MLFAFGRSEGRYFIANGKQNDWKGIPQSLSPHLREDYYVLQAIAFGEHDVWFYRDAPRTGHEGTCKLSPSVAVHYPRVHEICQSGESVNWVAFGPDGKYVVDTDKKLHHTDDGLVRKYKESGNQVPLRSASYGHDGAWVVVEDDGTVRSQGLSEKVKTALDKKPVRNAQLSGYSSSNFFIEYVDGDTDWNLPSTWHENIRKVEKMTVRLDEPGTKGEKTVKQKIIFAFGPKDYQYCISNGSRAHWYGMSDAMAERLRRPGKMEAFSRGENGACFWRQGDSTWLSDGTKMAYPEVWRIWNTGEKINWVAFGSQGYYIIDTKDSLYASRKETILRRYKESGKYVPLRCASFGYGGAWVVVENDGDIRSWGLSESVLAKLKVGSVRNVQLSQTDPDYCYVEYISQASDYSLPKSWHEHVKDIEGNLPKPKTS